MSTLDVSIMTSIARQESSGAAPPLLEPNWRNPDTAGRTATGHALHSQDEFNECLVRVEQGEHRPGFLRKLARYATTYYENLPLPVYARLARQLMEVARNEENSSLARWRAAEITLSTLRRAIRIVAGMIDRGEGGLMRILEERLEVFFDTLGPEYFEELAGIVTDLELPDDPKNAIRRVYRINSMIRDLVNMAETVKSVRDSIAGTRLIEISPDDPRIAAGRRELEEIREQQRTRDARQLGLSKPKSDA